MRRSGLLLVFLLVAPLLLLAQQTAPAQRYALPRRTLLLEDALRRLTEAGAELSYRPEQLPALQLRLPGGRRSTERWLDLLLRQTGLTYTRGQAGYLILPDPALHNQTYSLYGTVSDARTGERLIGATVRLIGEPLGTHTNEYGFYTLPAPAGRKAVRISYVGYAPLELDLLLRSDSLLDLQIEPNRELPQIIVTSTQATSREGQDYFETGTRIGRAEVAQLGGPGGEDDPLQLARLLPGVTAGSDGVGGLFIRGSDAGHNLVLLDGVPVYSLHHAGGLFSIFSNQAIRRIDLYKNALPVRFGGRIGGVLDVHTRDGNLYENEVTVGSSLLSAQLAAEGPIREGESSFLLTGRYFWAGALLRRFSQQYKENRGRSGLADYDVYDLNFKLNQRAGKRGRVYLSLYSGADDYVNATASSDTLPTLTVGQTEFVYRNPWGRSEQVRWGNTVGALRYNHVFNDRTFVNFRLSYSDLSTESSFERYDSLQEVRQQMVLVDERYSGRYQSDIRQYGVACDGQYTLDGGGVYRFGAALNLHRFDPRLRNDTVLLSALTTEENAPPKTEAQRPVEGVAYGAYEGRFGRVYYRLGLRAMLWHNEATDFVRLSPRLLLTGPLSGTTDWQFSYDRSVQPVQLLNSQIIGLPSDLWVPALGDLAPASADQLSAMVTHRPHPQWKVAGGAYVKRMHHLLAFSEGFRSAPNWWENLSVGSGRAFGLETTLQRSRGRLRGWLNYTLARTDRTFDESINLGRRFPFRYDRRHAFNLLVIYQLSERTTLTGSWRFETGLAYSLSTVVAPNPIDPEGQNVPLTEARNGFRLRPHHRLDLNLHTVLGSRNGRLTHAIDLGLYNAYNRHNPVYYDTRVTYRVEESQLNSRREFYQVYVAPLLPTLSYQLTLGGSERVRFGR